jgi:DUF971 family protein
MSHVDFQLSAVTITNHVDSGNVEITWSDGVAMVFAHIFLRENCKCADCTVAGDYIVSDSMALRLNEIRPAGSYGIQLLFNDGHDRGIYPWSYLHKLGSVQS